MLEALARASEIRALVAYRGGKMSHVEGNEKGGESYITDEGIVSVLSGNLKEKADLRATCSTLNKALQGVCKEAFAGIPVHRDCRCVFKENLYRQIREVVKGNILYQIIAQSNGCSTSPIRVRVVAEEMNVFCHFLGEDNAMRCVLKAYGLRVGIVVSNEALRNAIDTLNDFIKNNKAFLDTAGKKIEIGLSEVHHNLNDTYEEIVFIDDDFQATVSITLSCFPNLTYIGDRAFSKMEDAPNFSDLKHLTFIGENAYFSLKTAPNNLDMPELRHIGRNAFHSLESAPSEWNMPELRHIGESAFFSLRTPLNTWVMPNLRHIGDQAFHSLKKAPNVWRMPELRHVGTRAFCCLETVPNYWFMPKLERIEGHAFMCMGYGTEETHFEWYMIGLMYIGESAFTSLKVTPDFSKLNSLTHIGERAFSQLRSPPLEWNTPMLECIDEFAFENMDQEHREFNWNMPELKYIRRGAFLNLKKVPHLNMPKLEVIGQSAFLSLQTAPDFSMLESVTTIEDYAFFELKTYTQGAPSWTWNMPNLNIIGLDAFCSLKSKPDFSNLKSLRAIAAFAFKSLESAPTNWNMPNLEFIGNGAFYKLKSAPNFSKLKKVIFIGDEAFYSLEEAPTRWNMPNLNTIGKEAFYNLKTKPDFLRTLDTITVESDAFHNAKQGESLP